MGVVEMKDVITQNPECLFYRQTHFQIGFLILEGVVKKLIY